ncbi:MAG: aminomethyl-transferring glycine dehydrogenase subunit GcvPA [Candidatus Odinarchaeota archaeon]|nr:aminomethyl-transferring glycine dehydrogenase subunit GcvPA [Candidatus Odinarchaeota archaeon]
MLKHRYLPLTDEERQEMMKEIGVKDIEELFSDIPAKFRLNKKLNLPKGKSELETYKELRNLAGKNKNVFDMPTFLGGGVWPHYIPSAVIELVSRGEFLTAYTPYQPEISQGMLQALFEYQSLMAELLEMDVVNASMYDWGSSLGEAALMASRITRKFRILVPKLISPERLTALKTYVEPANIEIEFIDYEKETGELDLNDLKNKMNDKTAAVYIENPSYFGIIETKVDEIEKIVHDNNSLLIVGVDPTSLGLIRPPGNYNADIVVGEGQPLGNPVGYGGPLLGIFATKENLKMIKQMPGRIIGMTTTEDGKEIGFVMALQTREQHIRRERATSNICSNEALCAVIAGVYLSLMGPDGMKKLGETIFYNTEYTIKKLGAIKGLKVPYFGGVHFKEFLVNFDNVKVSADTVHKELLKRGIHGGHITKSDFPELGDSMLFCVTEIHTKNQIDSLVKALSDIVRGA